MQQKLLYLIIGVSAFLVSCKKVVYLDLKSVSPQIVIDADISDAYHHMQVQISTSVDYYAANVFPSISNALVYIKDSTDHRTDTLKHLSNGLYAGRFYGKPKHLYYLYVKVNGAEYTSLAQMPTKTEPDSVRFRKRTLFGQDIINPVVYFQDNAADENYYQFKQSIYRLSKVSSFALSDRLSNGRYISYTIRNDSSYLRSGDTVLITMSCLNKASYAYFNVLENVTTDNSGFSSSAPYNPPSNISNGSLGLFNVHTEYRQKVVVPQTVPNENDTN